MISAEPEDEQGRNADEQPCRQRHRPPGATSFDRDVQRHRVAEERERRSFAVRVASCCGHCGPQRVRRLAAGGRGRPGSGQGQCQ